MAGPGQSYADRLEPALGRTTRGDDAWEWQRAYEDALRSLQSLPDPALFAVSIDAHHREALRTAWRSREGWRVQPEYVRELRLLGLVEVSGDPHRPEAHAETRNYLSGFGMAVRRVVLQAEDLG